MINAIEFSKALLKKASLYQKINNIKNKKISVSIIGGEALSQSAIVIEEDPWDYSFLDIKEPPPLDYDKATNTGVESNISMVKVAKQYYKFFEKIIKES